MQHAAALIVVTAYILSNIGASLKMPELTD
jgi:hypothetical protein